MNPILHCKISKALNVQFYVPKNADLLSWDS